MLERFRLSENVDEPFFRDGLAGRVADDPAGDGEEKVFDLRFESGILGAAVLVADL